MANNYYCPECRANMNIGNSIVFGLKSPQSKRGILFLGTELGDYSKTTHPEFELQEGVEYNFYCPACHAKLNKQENPHLVKVYMTDDTGKEFEINISNIIGEHCTYKIQDKKAEAFGPDAERYMKYLDVPAEYRKYL